MWVFVIKATLESHLQLAKQTLIQIHLTMLPNKRTRFRTRVKPIENAMFAEEFFCKVISGSLVLFVFECFFDFRFFIKKIFEVKEFDFVCTQTNVSNANVF